MKPPLYAVAGFLLHLTFGCTPKDTAYQDRIKEWSADVESRLDAIERISQHGGRYSVTVRESGLMVLLDTTTGRTFGWAPDQSSNGWTELAPAVAP